MATFSNDLKLGGEDKRSATARTTIDKPRTFGALARDSAPDNKSTSNALSINYGNGATCWGANNIWSNGSLANGLGSRAATRENSRDGSRPVGHEDQMKGGQKTSGSLGMEDLWNREWKTSASRAASEADNGQNQMSSQRSVSHATVPAFSSSSFASRPPTISLNTTSPGAASGHRAATSNTSSARGYEPAPVVYTKHDRQQDPTARQGRDSAAAGPWSSVSPTDTRRPFATRSRNASQPMSRSNSHQYASPSDEQSPTFTNPNYGRGQQRSTTMNGSRAPSLSSQSMVPYSSFISPDADQLHMQFGQLSMNSDSRPQTSYRSSEGALSHPWSADISPLTRPSLSGSRANFGAAEEIEDYENDSHRYAAFPNALSPISANFSAQGYSTRFPHSAMSAEFRPGQGYMSGQTGARGFDMGLGSKSTSDWHSMASGMSAMQLSRPSFSAADQQAMMMPQMQELLMTQMRHYNPMFHPYAIPNAFQLNPYHSMMPMPYPTSDQDTAVQNAVAGESIQSALLYEFKQQNKSKRYELRDIYDHIAEFSGDQHGSRFIQTKIETANSDEKQRVFDEISPNAIQLMTDVFGNYVIQKFFEHGDQMHKRTLALKMKGHVLTLTNQMYGCRVVQKALDHVLVEQQTALVQELEGHVLRCVKDQNGNHVIQKAIERCPSHTIGFIISSFQNSVQQLSVNSYGCRVIQRCLEHCDRPSKAMIMSELMDGIQGMVTDQYGNYVVQHVVERDEGEGRKHVLQIVAKHLEMYSKHKFASNVVEKCLERAGDEWRQDVVQRLSDGERRGPDGESVLVGMIKDNYGNYVIQKLLDTLNYQDFFNFLDSLHPAVSQAKRTGCGKQIQSVERKMERFSRARLCLPAPAQASPPTGPGAPPAFNAGPQVPYHGHCGLPPHPPQLQTTGFASNFGSTGTTPPPLTADQSRQSSGLTSLNVDTVEGAHAHPHYGKAAAIEGSYMR